ncbi:tail fiber domain-containing protein, partial [Klebsiella pneumoniae]
TPFRVQRSRATTVSPADTFDDILVIDANNRTTLPGTLSAGGNIDNTSKGKVLTQAIELSMSTPYIDFHFNGSTADYTTRLIESVAGELTLEGAFMCKKHLYAWGAMMARSVAPDNVPVGQLLTGAPFQSMIQGRGANGDARGAVANYYIEELVGTEHRIVAYLDGYGRTDAWIFRAGGTLTTPKGDVLTTGSDVRLKTDFTQASENASERIERLGVCEYRMKGETRRRRGFIAQQAEKADDLYTFLGIEQEIDGEKFKVMNVDYTAIIADLVTVAQGLLVKNQELERRISVLEGI